MSKAQYNINVLGPIRKERRVLKMHVASISRDIPFLKDNKKLACGYIGIMEKLNNFVFELKKCTFLQVFQPFPFIQSKTKEQKRQK